MLSFPLIEKVAYLASAGNASRKGDIPYEGALLHIPLD